MNLRLLSSVTSYRYWQAATSKQSDGIKFEICAVILHQGLMSGIASVRNIVKMCIVNKIEFHIFLVDL